MEEEKNTKNIQQADSLKPPSTTPSFEERLSKARTEYKKDYGENDGSERNEEVPESHINSARAASEFLANVIAGGLLGYLFDRYFDSLPLGMLFLMIIGFVSGVYRANATMKKNKK